jgi:hypothetical protein
LANLVQAVAAGVLIAGAACAQPNPGFSHRALAQKRECVACHTSVARSTTIKSPTVTALAHFNHQIHVRFRTCVSCHTGIDTSEKTSKANFPPMSTCVTCHNQTDIPNGCWKCHDRAMKLEPETHVRGFIDTHTRGKMTVEVKQGCSVCHGQGFRCAGCH